MRLSRNDFFCGAFRFHYNARNDFFYFLKVARILIVFPANPLARGDFIVRIDDWQNYENRGRFISIAAPHFLPFLPLDS